MTSEQICTLLETTGYPVAYHHHLTPPEMPYIVYLFPYSNNFGADDKVYKQINHLQIELYTKTKDFVAEEKVETALGEIYFEKTEVYLESEKMLQIIYECEVL